MTAREFSALASAILIAGGTIWYMYVTVTGEKVRPVLASWAVFACTMLLSFATYWTAPGHSIISNASNAASVLSAVSMLFFLAYRERKKIVFSPFQKVCLKISGLIIIFWIVLVWGFHGTGFVPNILTQVLMVIGYVVTVQKLLLANKNTESFGIWGCITVASAIALYTGIVSHDILAILYATRATVTSAIVVGLMYRIEKKLARKSVSS